MIRRYYQHLEHYLKPNKVLVIYGPRRIGKTTLLNNFLENTKLKYKLDSGDNLKTSEILSSRNFKLILEYCEGYDLIAIDEAQQIPNIGMGLKIIVDQKPNISVIATGSSSFDLAHQIGEPLTGRKVTLTLYPIAQLELLEQYNKHELKERLEETLIFGSYPEIITSKNRQEKISTLEEIANSYLFKDILTLETVKNPKILRNLLKLLAFQTGNQVSLTELASQLLIDVKTVQRYLDLLEKSFIIIGIGAFSRNLRKEISKKQKYYFLDNGIRNSVISQFNELCDRNDVGQLWENFVMIERLKMRAYKGIYGQLYFWRTYDGQEIDLIEERDGKLFAFECKWQDSKKYKMAKDWQKNYSESAIQFITKENYLEFVV